MDDIAQRTELARALLARGIQAADLELRPSPGAMAAMPAGLRLDLTFPQGLEPTPMPIDPIPDPGDPLPRADVVVITWTIDEQDALADVLTPGYSRNRWYRYDRDFETRYADRIRGGAPSLASRRLGSYLPARVGNVSVLCFKSELHLNQDGKKTGEGTATLPVKDLFDQIIEEAQPGVVLTVGTAGSVFEDFRLGDVVVTRAAKFRLRSEFRGETFNGSAYRSDWHIPTDHLAEALALMEPFGSELSEPPFAPPTKRYHWGRGLVHTDRNIPSIKMEQDARDMPEFHPILTTDYFEFGTSANHLEAEGAAVEMGDAVLGLAIDERGGTPRWAVVRNMSDPQINGDLPTDYRLDEQTQWAVAYYTSYGYVTSVTGALTTWGILAGLSASGLPS